MQPSAAALWMFLRPHQFQQPVANEHIPCLAEMHTCDNSCWSIAPAVPAVLLYQVATFQQMQNYEGDAAPNGDRNGRS